MTTCLNIERDPEFGGIVAGDARLLLFLPLAHVFGRLAMMLAMSVASVIGFAPSHKTLAADMQTFKPTVLVLVPRVLETVYNRADAGVTGTKKRIFRWAAKVAREYGATRGRRAAGASLKASTGRGPPGAGKIRHALGGQLQLCAVRRCAAERGHRPLLRGRRRHRHAGLRPHRDHRRGHSARPSPRGIMGTVGHPIAGVDAALAEDGEIMLRGANLFMGYWNAPDATAEVMRDGWFATGDLGRIVDGSLSWWAARRKSWC